MTQTAQAEEAYVSGRLAGPESGNCTWGSGHIDSDRPSLSSRVTFDGVGYTPASPPAPGIGNEGYYTACGDTNAWINNGRLAVAEHLAYFDWDSGGWVWCNVGPWVANQTRSHEVVTGWRWYSPPCGASYYWMRVDGMAAPQDQWTLYGNHITYPYYIPVS